MAKITRKFYWQENTDLGDGWNPNPDDENSEIVSSFGLAHDTLEHINIHSSGWSTEDEFRAFGAMIFIRYEGNYWVNSYSPPERFLGEDLGRIAIEQVAYKGIDTQTKTNVGRIPCIEFLIDAIFTRAKEFIREEFNPKNDEYVAKAICENSSKLQNYFRNGAAYIREGYLRAKNGIFGNISSSEACEIFREIEEKTGKRVGEYGDRMTVNVDTDTGAVGVYVESIWEYSPEYSETY